MQRGLGDRKAVCPSVCLSVKKKESSADIRIPYERIYSSSGFLARRMVGGRRPLLPEILGQTDGY